MLRLASSLRLAGLLAAAFVASSLPARAQSAAKPLFDGKTLNGWITPDDKSLFTVEDGAIVGRTKGDIKKNEFLVTEKSYKDFTLKTKVKLRNGNSGVQVRSTRAADGAVSGPQADVADGYWGLLYEERGRGILKQYPPEEAAKIVKEGDWNDLAVTFKGKKITVVLNGVTVIDYEDKEFPDEGVVALQVHVGPAMEVRYKDVTIEELD